jgi:hypothetical protein
MELTEIILALYKGGQAEIQNEDEGYLCRGEIDDISVGGGNLTIRFAWCARGEGFPSLPRRWVNEADMSGYVASLRMYMVSDIGNGRIMLQSPVLGERTVLFPPDGSKLDPSKVEGLEIATVHTTNGASDVPSSD